ncbi:MAG: Hsp70 family protein [Phototrophicaceae bacterium]
MTIIGIDLGTTFSAASVVIDGKPQIIPLGNERIMPSVVGVSPDDKWLVGTPALNQWTLYPERTVRSIKRKMGTEESVLHGLAENPFRPEQISALILQQIQYFAVAHLQQDITQVVITVPAYFSDAERRATRLAGELAGLEVMRIINEPTAAALAYGMTDDSDAIALVYDLGGGTFDVSVVEMMAGVVDVRASHGDTKLGGDDFDERLAQWLTEQFEDRHNIDLRGNRQALARIRQAAENAKIALSDEPYTWVQEEYLAEKNGVPLHMEIEISRPQFVNLIDDLLNRTLESVARVLEDSEIEQPDHVMLVGGSTYIPAVRERITDYLGVSPRFDVNPSEAVALGAGIQGAIIEGIDIDAILIDITPFSLGIAIAEVLSFGGVIDDRYKVLIPRNSTIPTVQKEVFTTLHPDQTSVKIEVYQGEQMVASENTLLGEFTFDNLQPENPTEVAKFTVQFDLDMNGILNVQAVDRGSKQKTGITVHADHHQVSQRDLSSEPLPDVHFDFDAYDLEVNVELIPEELKHEADVLLNRAHTVDSDALANEIQAVKQALNTYDSDMLQGALEDLSDALFELED